MKKSARAERQANGTIYPSDRAYRYVYAKVTPEEYAFLKQFMKAEGLTMSNFVKRCVNSYLLEGADDPELLLTELAAGAPLRKKQAA